MKNILSILILLVVISSCKSNRANILSEDLLKQDNISNLVLLNHKKIENIKGNSHSFKIYLDSLKNDEISSIAFAKDYINTCIPIDTISSDSLFIYFQEKLYTVANILTDSFETKYPQLNSQLKENKKTAETKAFDDNLKVSGLKIFMTEGTYYFDVQDDYFYNLFKNRGSEGLKEYLKIRKNEMKQGFSEDAGLLISFEDLSQRVKSWENFIKNYPNHFCINSAKSYYKTYLETLLTGMDNSRTFDADSLRPDVKALYENIIKENIIDGSSKIISDYYKFLSRHNFRENDSINIFLKSKGLSSMIGIQPHLR